jgi:hypothetical protein
MGAPTVTARVDPPGIKLDDGHSTTFAFSADANVNLWEKTVTPPGIDGGDEIDTTTMHNNTWRTRAPRQLKTLTEMSCTCAYDPVVYTELLALINVRQSITVHMPDGSTVAFFGFLKNFEPGENSEGEQPTADVTIVPTNVDPDDGTEAAPVVASVAGT